MGLAGRIQKEIYLIQLALKFRSASARYRTGAAEIYGLHICRSSSAYVAFDATGLAVTRSERYRSLIRKAKFELSSGPWEIPRGDRDGLFGAAAAAAAAAADTGGCALDGTVRAD